MATPDDPKFSALLAESELSGSEFNVDDDKAESESESDVETTVSEGPELEDEEPDTKIQLKVGGKKQKKGLVARDQINVAAAAINNEPSPRLGSDLDCSGKKVAGISAGSKT